MDVVSRAYDTQYSSVEQSHIQFVVLPKSVSS